MSGLGDAIGQAFGQVLGLPLVGLGLRLLALYIVVIWLAAAYWTWRDARARTRNPLVPYLAAAGVVLVSPLLFPLAVGVYRLVRPDRTVAAAEASDLQLAMLEEDATRPTCAGCGAVVDESWVRCPSCARTLAVRCATCRRPIELDWTICAWCAADVPWTGEGNATPSAGMTAPEPVTIPIRPGGRPLVPVMAVPEAADTDPASAPSTRPARPRRRQR